MIPRFGTRLDIGTASDHDEIRAQRSLSHKAEQAPSRADDLSTVPSVPHESASTPRSAGSGSVEARSLQ